MPLEGHMMLHIDNCHLCGFLKKNVKLLSRLHYNVDGKGIHLYLLGYYTYPLKMGIPKPYTARSIGATIKNAFDRRW